MGRIVRCLDTGEVKNPLYVAAAGIHLYSLEELSYFLQHFLYLIDDAFFDTELMRFLREDLNRRDLAELVVSRVSQVSSVVLAGELACATGDMDETERKFLKEKVSVFQKLPDSGKKKLQADLFLKHKEYDKEDPNTNSISNSAGPRIQYQRLGAVWHQEHRPEEE